MAKADAKPARAAAGGVGAAELDTPEGQEKMVALVRFHGSMARASIAIGRDRTWLSHASRSRAPLRARLEQAMRDHCEDRAKAALDRKEVPPSAPLRAFTDSAEDKAAFLNLLAGQGGVATAAAEMGVTLLSLFAVREADPEFSAAWKRAHLHFLEVAESELLRVAGDLFSSDPIRRRRAAQARPVDLKAARIMMADTRAQLTETNEAVASARTYDEEAYLESARLELEQRLCGLVERWGDPFGDDPARPFRRPAPRLIEGTAERVDTAL